jgi:hypothetical protein
MIKITFPFSEELLDELFAEFDWERQDAGLPHPVTTGNCSTGHPRPRGRDNGDIGEYQNAAYYCRHCYPGNPARIAWDREANAITVEADEGSSKAFRAILTHRRLLRPLVGGVMLTSIEDLRGLRLISFPNEDD